MDQIFPSANENLYLFSVTDFVVTAILECSLTNGISYLLLNCHVSPDQYFYSYFLPYFWITVVCFETDISILLLVIIKLPVEIIYSLLECKWMNEPFEQGPIV